jgi:hypothetical protein
VDRDGHRLLARVAAHLTDTAVHLKPGHVLRLKLFNDMLMKPHERTAPMAVIVIVQMDVIGSGPFLVDETDMTTPTLDVVSPTDPMETPVHDPQAFDDKDFEPPPAPDKPCSYGSRRCSVYGLDFRRCICDKIPVADQDLASIMGSCPFVTHDSVDDLANNEKSNILYWWYATNVFLICGKKQRGLLPDCLVYAIRRRYPNQKGIKYVGFREWEDDSSDNKKRQRS